MGAVAEISEREFRLMPHLHSRPIAIAPWLRRVHGNLALQFELRSPAQGFAQDFLFVLKLRRVVEVLVMTSAAAAEIRTRRHDSLRRRRDDALEFGAAETSTTLDDRGFDGLAGDHKRHEDGLAAAVLVRRQPGQSVSAIDQFFDLQLQYVRVEQGGQRATGWRASFKTACK